MAGVTFLAFGNGSPDVFSTFAAMKTHSGSLAIGELIGAAGFITAVVAGSMALVRPFKVARKSFVRDVGFFIVAASFSMVFLADGHLHLWECAVMVAFYVFYVMTVVAWHWYLTRKTRRRERELAARGQFHVPASDEAATEAYADEDDDGIAGGGRTPLRAPSADDFANLERGSPILMPTVEDADDQTRDHWMAEISSNMRVSRPRHGERRNTINPIRPSLVGALEFRAVLSSLQKSRNIQSIPISLRRYSDDPTYTFAQQQDQLSTASNPEISSEDAQELDGSSSSFLRPSLSTERATANRARAVSANGVSDLEIDPKPLQRPPVPEIDFLDATPPGTARSNHSNDPIEADRRGGDAAGVQTPIWSLSPPRSELGYLVTSPAPISAVDQGFSTDLLAPPGGSFFNHLDSQGMHLSVHDDGLDSPGSAARSEPMPRVPHIKIPRPSKTQGSSPASPFPLYHDDPNFMRHSRTPSLRLPPPSIGSESSFRQNIFGNLEEKPVRWWPYRFLPAPQVLISTLFPTLYSWHDKNAWEKFLGVVAAPSVLLLVITLPVVEPEKDEDLPDPDPGLLSPNINRSRPHSTTAGQLLLESPPSERIDNDRERLEPHLQSSLNGNKGLKKSSKGGTKDQNHTTVESAGQQSRPNPAQRRQDPEYHSHESQNTLTPFPPSPKDWNRWLVVTQIFTAPFFIVVLYWANTDADLSGRNLLMLALYSLVISLVLFAILLLTTTTTRPPRYRYLFCFLGFVVSIAWISTIANEVVGVLKAFGVILGISDAILGLTIFAVGNSLGDLVADITVARLGYPVMALSACFGGPMLNILLGIGLSGLYMTIKSGHDKHERHPDKPMKYKPYQIDVGGTLIISGITLLVTLLGLLVVVPLNKWKMDRRIGWGLMALWCASTVGNVVVEVTGWGNDTSWNKG